jgi:protease-4
MLEERPSFLTRVLRGLDGLRRFLVNVLFFGLLAGLVIEGLGGRPKVPDGAALVLNPRGTIVEELASVDPVERLVARSTGTSAVTSETLLRDLVDALRLAKDDARIKAVYLDTNDMAGAGFTKLRDLRAALADFKKSGKKVIAYGDDYLQPQYYLAAQADEVYLHPEGMVLLEGFGRQRNYYKQGLDRFGIEMHVFRVGEYKSAVEPYLRDDMSKEAREMSLDTYGDLWRGWLADVGEARKLTPDAITALVEGLPDRLRAADGDMAKLAEREHLVDTLAPRDEVRKRLIALVGEDKEKHSFKQVGFATYLKAKGGDRTGVTGRGKAVAVVVANPRERSAATRRPGCCGAPARTRPSARWCCASTAPAAAPSLRRSSAASASWCGRPASRSWSRWARWRPRAATGSRPRPTRSGRRRRRSRARSGSSGCSRASTSRSPSTSASTPTASARRASATCCGPTGRSIPRSPTS